MNVFTKQTKTTFLALGFGLLGSGGALASSTFNSSAALTFVIDGIENQTNPGSLTGLEILGTFDQIDAPGYAGGDYSLVGIVGDGQVKANNPAIAQAGGFSKTFTVSGIVSNGSIDSHHLGWYGLTFQNTGTDVYTISAHFDYELHAGIGGENGFSSVTVDYFNEDGLLLSGYDSADAAFIAPNVLKSGTSGLFNFSLAAGAFEGLYADVVIDAHLQASPVPLPAAVWSFLAGLLGILKMKKRAADASGLDQKLEAKFTASAKGWSQ